MDVTLCPFFRPRLRDDQHRDVSWTVVSVSTLHCEALAVPLLQPLPVKGRVCTQYRYDSGIVTHRALPAHSGVLPHQPPVRYVARVTTCVMKQLALSNRNDSQKSKCSICDQFCDRCTFHGKQKHKNRSV